ncbi:MAG: LCP family protein [Clostridia bacterium]|nr:LCP family protein [Clostridia bacterium]
MNLRKFYLISSLIISIFLFIIGIGILSYLGRDTASASTETTKYLDKIFDPFIEKKDPINILLLGADKSSGNTDTIMLVNFNQETMKINVLSIPRDTKIYVKGSSLPKINSAYGAGGEKLAVDTVSKLLTVPIKYYVYINTASFRKIIDILGGVDYNVPVNMDYDDPTQDLHIHLKKGPQHLDGKKAEQFMRFRNASHANSEILKYYDGSDLKRIEAQQNFIKEVIRQKTNVLYITKLNSLLQTIYSNLETNMNMDDALKLAQNFIKLKVEDVSMFKLPGKAKDEPSGSYVISYFIHDSTQTSEMVKKYFYSQSEYAGGVKSKIDSKDHQIPSDTAKPKKTPSTSTEKKDDLTKNNPSNNETGIKGTNKPAP